MLGRFGIFVYICSDIDYLRKRIPRLFYAIGLNISQDRRTIESFEIKKVIPSKASASISQTRDSTSTMVTRS